MLWIAMEVWRLSFVFFLVCLNLNWKLNVTKAKITKENTSNHCRVGIHGLPVHFQRNADTLFFAPPALWVAYYKVLLFHCSHIKQHFPKTGWIQWIAIFKRLVEMEKILTDTYPEILTKKNNEGNLIFLLWILKPII